MNEILSRIARKSENRNTEYKNWFDPSSNEGIAKIAKGCIALYNCNGGYLLIGISDNGDQIPLSQDDAKLLMFNQESVQEIVSKYSSIRFEIDVDKYEIDDGKYIVAVKVPSGFTSPAVCTRDLIHDSKQLLRRNSVYYRTYAANHIISSSEANGPDWELMSSEGFLNREMAFADFINRHFRGNITNLQLLSTRLNPQTVTVDLESGRNNFFSKCSMENFPLSQHGYFEFFGSFESSEIDPILTRNKLQLILFSNPELTGWPLWINSYGLKETAKPTVEGNRWKSFIDYRNGTLVNTVDYWEIVENSKFYCARVMQEEFEYKQKKILDPRIAAMRIFEAMRVIKSFTRASKESDSNCTISFGFRATGLYERHLGLLTSPAFGFPTGRCMTPSITVIKNFELADGFENEIDVVYETLRKLLSLFEGATINRDNVKSFILDLLQRRP